MTMTPTPRKATQVHYNDDMCSTTNTKSFKNSPLVETKKNKKVCFNLKIDVREVPHWKDLPEAEIVATWYTQHDFQNIKKSLITTIRLMMAKKPIEEDQCARGLEFRTPAGAKMRKENKLKSLTAVWNEQVAQWREDRTDEEAISFVYQQEIQECRTLALRLGLQDEKDARRYLESDDSDDTESDFSTISIEESENNELNEPHRSTIVPTAA